MSREKAAQMSREKAAQMSSTDVPLTSGDGSRKMPSTPTVCETCAPVVDSVVVVQQHYSRLLTSLRLLTVVDLYMLVALVYYLHPGVSATPIPTTTGDIILTSVDEVPTYPHVRYRDDSAPLSLTDLQAAAHIVYWVQVALSVETLVTLIILLVLVDRVPAGWFPLWVHLGAVFLYLVVKVAWCGVLGAVAVPALMYAVSWQLVPRLLPTALYLSAILYHLVLAGQLYTATQYLAVISRTRRSLRGVTWTPGPPVEVAVVGGGHRDV